MKPSEQDDQDTIDKILKENNILIKQNAQKYVITLNTSHGCYFQPSTFLTHS